MKGPCPLRVALLGLAAAGALACTAPAAAPLGPPLTRARPPAPIVPDVVDHLAADLAVAVLGADPARVEAALDDFERATREQPTVADPTGLVPAGLEAAHAVLSPGRAGRAAAERLLERDDVDAVTRRRLERWLADDPLRLAAERIGDARFGAFARLFNSFSEPVGRSIFQTALLPYRLGRALAQYSLGLVQEDELPLERRQALEHWKRFRRRHPHAPEVAELEPRIAAYQASWHATRYTRALDRARDARDAGRPQEAWLYARRALRHDDGDEARALLREAETALEARRLELARALGFEAAGEAPIRAGERGRVLAALAGPGAPADVAASPPGAGLDAEQSFRRATLQERAGSDAGLEALRELAERSETPMARHAAALLRDPWRNPYGAFQRARAAERRRKAMRLALGPLADRPETDALGLTQYLLDLPLRLQGAALLPLRVLMWPWSDPTPGDADTAVHARRYLARHPRGAHAAELRDWLEDFERGRENWIGALRVAEGRAVGDDGELDALRERAAGQALGVAASEERSPLRAERLRQVARLFSETRAGRDAGRQLREEVEERTLHEIRLSRGFLLENPALAGPDGLDLAPALLDDEPRNGELHPDGVALVGRRWIALSVLAEGGDEDDPPERLTARVSAEKLARLVARLEETSFRNSLLDEDDALESDAQRDVVFERARLGLADQTDPRPGAEARYAYLGVRERYGMVRSREALLPVELVLQGSLTDLTLGAFPRLRPPRRTPDAVLYRD